MTIYLYLRVQQGCRGFIARSIRAFIKLSNIACLNESTVKCSTGVTKPLEEVSKVRIS